MPKTVKLYKETFNNFYPNPPFSGNLDLSSREDTAAANTIWNIWHDERTGQDMRSTAAHGFVYNDPQATLTILTGK